MEKDFHEVTCKISFYISGAATIHMILLLNLMDNYI